VIGFPPESLIALSGILSIGGVWVLETVQPGAATAPCAAGTAGQIQWTGAALQYCNGSTWNSLGGTAITLGTSTSATNPQRSSDATTGIFSSAASTVAIATGGNQLVTVGTTGMAIGTSYASNPAPSNGLIVQGQVVIGGNSPCCGSAFALEIDSADVVIENSHNLLVNGGSLDVHAGGTLSTDKLRGDSGYTITFGDGGGGATFATYGPSINFMTGTGGVGIGTTAPAEPLEIYSSGSGALLQLAGSSGTCNHTPGSSSETVSCSSDMRLKSDTIDAPSLLPWLSSIRVRDFTWKNTGQKRTGVIAQELQKTHPEMVAYNRSTDEWTVEQPNPWVLVKLLQEEQVEIDDLKKQLAAKR
jgi:hypothetical protein